MAGEFHRAATSVQAGGRSRVVPMRSLLPLAGLVLVGCAAPAGSFELAAYAVTLPPELDGTELFVDWNGDDPMRSVRCALSDDGWSATWSLTVRDAAIGDGFDWSMEIDEYAGPGAYEAVRSGVSVVSSATGAF